MNIKILSNKIENIFNKHKIPSLSVIITNKNKNIFEQYHGYNHLEKKIALIEIISKFVSPGLFVITYLQKLIDTKNWIIKIQ